MSTGYPIGTIKVLKVNSTGNWAEEVLSSDDINFINGLTASGAVLDINTKSDHDVTISRNGEVELDITASGVECYNNLSVDGDITVTGKTTSPLSISSKVESYTLQLSDNGTVVNMDSGSALNLTVPLDSSVNFPIGSVVSILQNGEGQVTLVPSDIGVTLNSPSGLKIKDRYGIVSLLKVAANTWAVVGNLTS